jgi:hypothetical protein
MSKYSLEIKWGLFFIGATLLWMVFEKAMGWHGELIGKHATYTNIFAIIAIALYVFALLAKRKQLGGKMSWKEGFIAGMIITAVVTVLSPFMQWLVNTVISPEYLPNAIQYAVENGKATQEQAESYFNVRSYIMQATIGALVMGAITSATVALFVRRK